MKSNNQDLQPPKGTRDLLGDDWLIYQGLMEKAAEIALYYGFQPIQTPLLESEDLFIRSIGESTDIVEKEIYRLKTRGGDQLVLRPELTAPIMRAYFNLGLQSQPQPVMLFSAGPVFRHDRPQRGRWREFYQFDLEVIGTSKSIADAMIIKMMIVILDAASIKNPTLELNSLGDKTCRQNYRRELVAYYRRHARRLCVDCQERLKTNPLRLLDCKEPACQTLKDEAPAAVSCLCGPCRAHFKEVLEYLDAMGLTYNINNSLVRGLDYYTRTVFEITAEIAESSTEEKEAPITSLAIAGGGRYDYLAREIGHTKEVPAVGAAIGLDRLLLIPGLAKLRPRIVKKPRVFFIQLGFDAKLKSFDVIEILRQARIPVAHSLSKDSLAAQLAIAEKLAVPYAIILGQKEALESSVIFRQMTSRSQDTVKIADLAQYLKKLK